MIVYLPKGLTQKEIPDDAPRSSCGHCGNKSCTDLIAEFVSNREYAECVDDWTTWKIYYCPNCNNINVERTYVFSEDSYTDHNGNTIYNETTKLLYPIKYNDVSMSSNIPEEMVADYEEAQMVAAISPRSAAALLRLLLEKLCKKYLSKTYPNLEKLDEMIGALVSEGIPQKIQQACDIVRITGNSTVHAGMIDVRDDSKITSDLFELVNMIANYLDVHYKKIEDGCSRFSQGQREHIAKRNAKCGSK